jgi:hypothetical protein
MFRKSQTGSSLALARKCVHCPSDQRGGATRPGTTLGYSGSILLLVWLILSCLTLLCLPSFSHAVDLVMTGCLHV